MTPHVLALALSLPGPGFAPVLPALAREAACGAVFEVWPDDPRFPRLLRELRVPEARRGDVERVRVGRSGVRVVARGRVR